MKILTLYYSFGGNTERIAKRINRILGGDISQIMLEKPYEGSYDEIVDEGKREVESGFMPKIKPLTHDPKDYDVIILGTPVWWYTFAPAMKTALEKYNYSDKIIYPFATNGGWIGHTFKDIKNALPNATLEKGLDILFNEDNLRTDTKKIDEWINNIKTKIEG